MNWNQLTTAQQLDEIIETSAEKPVVIFKHSTRCSISSTALSRLERAWDADQTPAFYLDLIAYRPISGLIAEKFDVEAMIAYCFETLHLTELWVVGWSFGTSIAISHARDPRVKGLILLSPTLLDIIDGDLEFWAQDGRPMTALIPEFDDYLKPDQAQLRFAVVPQVDVIAVVGAKHLWVGEPYVHRVLSEITRIVAPNRLPLPTEV